VGEPNPKRLETNRGAIEVFNTGSTTIHAFWIQSVAANGDSNWAFGFGDWGPQLGPVPPGASVWVTTLGPADDWAIKFDGTVRVSPKYSVVAGQTTAITISH
jgi:hypothetical protein